MELFPIITNVLLALGGIFLIVLIVSFLISKFRKEKEEIITETYPAQKYQYFSGSASNFNQRNLINDYYTPENSPIENNYSMQINNEGFQEVYSEQYDENQFTNYGEPVSYVNDWVDNEEEIAFENPLRKTSAFNFGYSTESNELIGGRMQIINAGPNYKFGWE